MSLSNSFIVFFETTVEILLQTTRKSSHFSSIISLFSRKTQNSHNPLSLFHNHPQTPIGEVQKDYSPMIILKIMRDKLILRECILFLEQEVPFYPTLSLKIACGSQIYKLHDFHWNTTCKRWQRPAETAIPWPQTPSLQMELYHQENTQSPPIVLAEGVIPLSSITASLRREIRINLLLDGLYMGCLFCSLDDGPKIDPLSSTFFYLHKIDLILLQNLNHSLHIHIMKNQEQVYQKAVHLQYKSKTVFPNLKIPVKMSDVIVISLEHSTISIKQVKFVMDSVKRGKTSIFQAWLRNPIKNKVGDIKLEYFLQNIFLDNQRQVFSRIGIYPNRIPRKAPTLTEGEKDKLRRSVIIRQLEEADRRIIKLSTSLKKMISNIEGSQTTPMPKPSRSYVGTLTSILQ